MFELSNDRPLIAGQISNGAKLGGLSPTLTRFGHSPRLQMDWDYLNHLSDNSPEFEMELLQLYLDDSSSQVALLRQAIATQNVRQAEQLAHHLKGSSANIGARALEHLAAGLESCFEHRQFHKTEAMLTEFESLLTELATLL